MAGQRDPTGLDLEARFATAFQELLELTWAEHQALVDQLEQVVAMQRQLLEVWRSVGGRRGRLQEAQQAAQAPDRAADQTSDPATTEAAPRHGTAGAEASQGSPAGPGLTDLPGVGKIRAKSLEGAGYDLARLTEASPEDLIAIRGIGASMASDLIEAAQELQAQGA